MEWQLLIDFGLVILIWMTQLVVYPSFTYFQEADLINWHRKYTTSVSILVLPLMLCQVILHFYGLYDDFGVLRVVALILIGLAWINTFLIAVPLHNKIRHGNEVMALVQRLIHINLYRTAIWTAVFLISLYYHLRN